MSNKFSKLSGLYDWRVKPTSRTNAPKKQKRKKK
jgi:hypothetical protein